jgi:amidase
MYVDADEDAGVGATGIGGPTGRRIETRPSVLDLFDALRRDLVSAGAEVVDVDFPVVSNYEGDRAGAPTIATRGWVSREYLRREIVDLSAWAWDDFLAANGDPALNRLADVDGSRIFPHPDGALPDRYTGFDDDIATYPAHVAAHPYAALTDIAHLDEVRGLEETRRIDLEEWMDGLGLDALLFPAVADVARADMDTDPDSAEAGWRNGVWVANGNLVPRHLGIPTVTVPMGLMAETGMPVGLTLAGRAYDDSRLLTLGAAFEALAPRRTPPPLTPPGASVGAERAPVVVQGAVGLDEPDDQAEERQ